MRKNTELEHGDLRKIAKMTGFTYAYVRDVLVTKRRNNNAIVEASNKIKRINNEVLGCVSTRKIKAA